MNSRTKILVINSRDLIISIAIGIMIIAIIIILIITTGNSDKASSTTNSSTYTPGLYTSSITISGNPVDIEVCVDSTNIRSITLNDTNDYIATMYPLLNSVLNQLALQICENNSTANIAIDENNQYTSLILLDAINSALKKATN